MIKYDSFTKQLQINRGDSTTLKINAKDSAGEQYQFKVGEKYTIYVSLINPENYEFEAENGAAFILLFVALGIAALIIGNTINNLKLYSVLTLNNEIQTIIGYDDDGAKEFVLNPEAGDVQ